MAKKSYSSSGTITYSPRKGVSYTATYKISNGMLYPSAQGFDGTPVHLGNLPESTVAGMAVMSMIADYKLQSDQEVA